MYDELIKTLRNCVRKEDSEWNCAVCEYENARDCFSVVRQEAADAIEELIAFDIRNLPEGLYAIRNGVVYTARMKFPGGNVLNMKTGESHWEDDRIVGGEQVFPKLPKMEVQDGQK